MAARQFLTLTSLLLAVSLPLGACSGFSRDAWEQAIAPDPTLQEDGANLQSRAILPPDFPSEIPRYPGAALQSVTVDAANDAVGNAGADTDTPADTAVDSDDPMSNRDNADATVDASPDATTDASPDATSAQRVVTRWQTRDSADQVWQYYQQQFQPGDWQVQASGGYELSVIQDDLDVQLIVFDSRDAAASDPSPSPIAGPDMPVASDEASDTQATDAADSPEAAEVTPVLTEFILSYRVGVNPDEALGSTASQDFVDSNATDSSTGSESNAIASPRPAQRYTDLATAPEPLRPYLTDLAGLGVLDSGSEFQPNEPVTRRAYARWLMAANNRIHSAQPDKQIRTAVGSSQPAFQDVPTSDPDFGAIQGLANAGIIPSPLSGNTTTVAFRPDAPLTREDLVLWKMPLDLRRSLPEASIDAVEQTWGFQDTAQIQPRALRAVLADYQNSDLSNIRRAFGYTTLFQPKAAVTRAEAAATLWRFGMQGEGVTAKDAAE